MSDMTSFARKLMRINQRVVRSNTPSAIFGTIGDLPQAVSSRPALRIGLWPCISEEKPEIAMGLWVALAHLLERWRDIEVYRIFAKLEDDFVWSMASSQFEVEEFELEALDENIGIWGKLEREGDKWKLTATLDNDNLTGEDNEAEDLSIFADSPIDFIAMLPTFADAIAKKLDATLIDSSDVAYPSAALSESAELIAALQKFLAWEVNLIASLWGIEWEDVDFEDAFDSLLDSGEQLNNDFIAWMTAKAVAETMRPGYSVLGDLLVKRVRDVLETFPNSDFPAPILATAIFYMGFAPNAYHLLETEIKNHPKSVLARLTLAQAYGIAGSLSEALNHFQTAIEDEVTNKDLYRAYGNTLLAAEQYGIELDSFILIELDKHDGDYILWEAVAAYGEVLAEDPDDIRALYSRLQLRIQLGANDSELWQEFRKLLIADSDGEFIRDAIDGMYDLGAVHDGVNEIITLMKEQPERLDLYINLAALYLVNEEHDSAVPLLQKALPLAKETVHLAEIERLLLSATDDEFENHFAELTGILEAGNEISADDVEFLENAAENAPHFIPVHLALARAYHIWDDNSEALEVLLRIQETMPDNIDVLVLLASILWEVDEKVTAFQYLNRGIAAYPYSVVLIASAGRYLFENGQYKESKAYLARAEEIAPGNPELQGVRKFIARQLAENPNLAALIEEALQEEERDA